MITAKCQAFALEQWFAVHTPSSVLLGAPLVKVKSSGEGRGLGLFTTRDVEAFSVLLSEEPLVLMQPGDDLPELYALFTGLPEDARRAYMKLSHHDNPARDAMLKDKLLQRGFGLENLQEMAEVAGIMQANAFNVDTADGRGSCHRALFLRVARINHSCAPNAHVCFYPGQPKGRMVIHTLRRLQAGEEILISYFSILLPFAERQLKSQKWGFRCQCPVCDDLSPHFREEEACRQACRDFGKQQAGLVQRCEVSMKNINRILQSGQTSIDVVKKKAELLPALPDLYDGMASIRTKALRVQNTESDRADVLSLLEQATLCEARITGVGSQATSRRLRKLAQLATTRAMIARPRIVIADNGLYAIQWQGD